MLEEVCNIQQDKLPEHMHRVMHSSHHTTHSELLQLRPQLRNLLNFCLLLCQGLLQLESVEVTVGVTDCSPHLSQPLQGLSCSWSLNWLILQTALDQDNQRVTMAEFLVKDVNILPSTFKFTATFDLFGLRVLVGWLQQVLWEHLDSHKQREVAEGEHIQT